MKISQIITKVNSNFGTPMGRLNIGSQPITITSGKNCRIIKKNQIKVYTKKVPMCEGYDLGGAYWGYPHNLYVNFTKDLSYIEFYRNY